jgi:hypothetical protein
MMPFALYLTLVAGFLSQPQADVRGPVAVEAERFDRSIRAFDALGWLRVKLAEYTSGGTRAGDAPEKDDRFPGPPPSPGEEPRLTTDSTGVLAHCDAIQAALEKRGMKVVRKVISQNSEYGVVWRADIAVPGNDSPQSRLICWKRPGHDDYSILDHPLEMFDPSASIAPLAP